MGCARGDVGCVQGAFALWSHSKQGCKMELCFPPAAWNRSKGEGTPCTFHATPSSYATVMCAMCTFTYAYAYCSLLDLYYLQCMPRSKFDQHHIYSYDLQTGTFWCMYFRGTIQGQHLANVIILVPSLKKISPWILTPRKPWDSWPGWEIILVNKSRIREREKKIVIKSDVLVNLVWYEF